MTAPTINITETIGLTNVDNAESTTNWAGFQHSSGGTPSPVLDNDIFVQGSAAISTKVNGSNQDEGLWYTNVGAVDLTTDANKHVYVWIAATTISQHNTIAAGGLYIVVGSSTSDWSKWSIAGSDHNNGSGFTRYVIDVTKEPSFGSTGSGPDLTAVTHIGAGIRGTVSAKSENLIVDRIDYGTGIQIEDGDSTTPCSWQELFDDDNLDANKYGIIEKRGGVFYLKGGIQIGDGSGTKTTLWDDTSDAVVVWENPLYHTGPGSTNALVSAIDSEVLYKIVCEGNGTGTTDIKFGEELGTGDDRQGVSGGQILSAGLRWAFDGATNISDLDTVQFYGTTIQRCDPFELDIVTKGLMIGCVCSETFVDSNEAELLNCVFSEPDDEALLYNSFSGDVSNCKFVLGDVEVMPAGAVFLVNTVGATLHHTEDFNDGTSFNLFLSGGTVGDVFYFGADSKFQTLRLDVTTASTVGQTIWEFWDGALWMALENLDDHTKDEGDPGSFYNSGVNDLTWRPSITWTRYAPDNITRPLFFVRVRLTTEYSGTVAIDGGDMRDKLEYSCNIPADGTVNDFTNMQFFGSGVRKYDIGRGSTSLNDDEYALSNHTLATRLLGDGTNLGLGQSWTSSRFDKLTRVRVLMRKTGTPTGTVVCNIYAHSGTFGTSSIPTGSPLAVSETIDLSDMDDHILEYDFEFKDSFVPTSTTKYVVTIEYSGGDVSNHLEVGVDTTSPTHGGNQSTLVGSSWTGFGGVDIPFRVRNGGRMIVEQRGTSDAVTTIASVTQPSATIMPAVNILRFLRTIEVTGVTEGSRVSVHRESDGLEILNALAFEDDGAGAFKASITDFIYTADVAVLVKARSQGKPVAAIASDGSPEVHTDETIEANDSVANNMTLLPVVPEGSEDKYYFGHTEQFSQLALEVGTGSTGIITLIWEYWDGDSWEALSDIVDGTSRFEQSGIVSWTIPGDWATETINSQGPYYYVRGRISSVSSPTQALGDKVTLAVTRYRPFTTTATITNDGLSVRADWIVDPIGQFPTTI